MAYNILDIEFKPNETDLIELQTLQFYKEM